MTSTTPRQPPRFVPTLTERVQSLAAAASPAMAEPVQTVMSEAPQPHAAAAEAYPLPSEELKLMVDAWLDRWLAEHAPVLLEQLLDRVADDLRHSFRQQVLQSLSSGSAQPLDR